MHKHAEAGTCKKGWRIVVVKKQGMVFHSCVGCWSQFPCHTQLCFALYLQRITAHCVHFASRFISRGYPLAIPEGFWLNEQLFFPSSPDVMVCLDLTDCCFSRCIPLLTRCYEDYQKAKDLIKLQIFLHCWVTSFTPASGSKWAENFEETPLTCRAEK